MDTLTCDSDDFEFPCSYAQQRLWMDDKLAGGSSFYNIHASLRLRTALDPVLLEQAQLALVRRHESLRTSFPERAGTPVQRVAGSAACDFGWRDLGALRDPAAREAELMAFAYAQAAQPFQLERGPLLRVRLLSMGPAECVLMLTIHHIVADAWSMAVLLRELTALYRHAGGAAGATLPPLTIQYPDYAVWQRQAGTSTETAGELLYWRERLAGLASMDLPLDHRRPPVASHRGRTLHFQLPAGLSNSLLSFARRCMATPYAVLLAALALVFQRSCGQDEVVIGMPVAGRDRPELEHLIGFFVNTLVLRLDVGGSRSFLNLTQAVQSVVQEALSHQALPFERLVEELHPPRDLSRNPLFQVSAQFLSAPGVADSGPSAAASVLDVQRGAANFDLAFDFWHAGGCLEGRVDFAIDLFEQATVERWIAQLQHVLEQALEHPKRAIDGLDPLRPEERALLDTWACRPHDYPRDANLRDIIAAVIARQPQAPALSSADGVLSYAELDERSRALAGRLAAQGVGSGTRVGIALGRSPEQILALLAVVRLGATYVALDPRWPGARLRHCIDSAAIVLAVCADADRSVFATLGLPSLGPETAAAPQGFADAAPAIDPLAPLYIAFTSGSTGSPKGVLVPHRAVLRMACTHPDIPLTPNDTMLLYAPLAFDASTLEIWCALCNGACLSIAPPGALGLDELAGWMADQHVNAAWLTAGLFHQMAAAHPAVLGGLRLLYAGGDVLAADAVRRVLAAGRVTVINGYGPTENTTFACVHAMRAPSEVGDPVPIGRPFAGDYVQVLDRQGRLAPIGAAGELVVGGDGVALGYLGAGGAEAGGFGIDPLAPLRGRVYRTGDRVRWRAGGVLEFLGRADRQVKVRGYRIEPGEVENALRALGGVSDAYVAARADASGDKTLVAYAAAPGLAPAELAAQLAQRLPAWMLPSQIYVCSELRLTANGKIDHTALEALSAPAAVLEPAELEGEAEQLVAQIWSEVLGREISNARADFFAELGGHSLLATQVVSRLNAMLDIALPLATMFAHPTIRAMALAVEQLLLCEVPEDLT